MQWKSERRIGEKSSSPCQPFSTQASSARRNQGQRGVVSIVCSRAYVVDGRERRDVAPMQLRPGPARGRAHQGRSSAMSLCAAAEHDPTATRAARPCLRHRLSLSPPPWRSKSPGSAGRRVSGNAIAASSSVRGTITLVRISSARRSVFRFPTMKSARGTRRAPEGNKFYFRIECQQRRHAIRGRGCVAEIAGHGAAILDLDPADFAGRALQRVEASGQRSGDDFAPGCQPADADVSPIRLQCP